VQLVLRGLQAEAAQDGRMWMNCDLLQHVYARTCRKVPISFNEEQVAGLACGFIALIVK
jgi:hypothetical protein